MLTDSERTMRDDARQHARQAVDHIIRAERGTGAFVNEPIAEGLRTTVPTPVDALHAVTVARHLADAAQGIMRDEARRARGRGASWAELAAPLGIDDEHGHADGRARHNADLRAHAAAFEDD